MDELRTSSSENSQNAQASEQVRVLVLDGETRAALAVVRSLGAKGFTVGVSSAEPAALACTSMWVDTAFVNPDPLKYPDRFTHWLDRTIELWRPTVVLPVTDVSLGLVLEFEDAFRERTVIPSVSHAVYRQVSDKAGLMERAAQLGIHVPRTSVISTEQMREEVLEEIQSFSFPVVVKPRSSVQRTGASVVKADVSYAHDAEEVFDILELAARYHSSANDFLVQEKISGVGVGVFALCFDGEILTSFAHERLLEKPPSGGRSVLSRSIAPEDAPMDEALRLLKEYNWSGVAMVEFKRSEEGIFYLMEINPRFWGSLQLAIDAGRDFPACLLDMVCAKRSDEPKVEAIRSLPPYDTSTALRWELGCVDHLLIKAKQAPLKTLKELFCDNPLRLRDKALHIQWEVNRSGDRRPFLTELRQWFLNFLRFGT